jgi:YbgC/YbaW family acyl-CoA thioester hydrolase
MSPTADHVEYKKLIREHHLDTYGHINNATYMALLEEARWDYITNNGYGLKVVQEKRQGPVVLEATMKFKKEIKLRETVTIRSRCLDLKGVTGKFEQTIFKENGEVSCEAHFVFGLFDLDRRKLIPPTPEWMKGMGF